MPVDYSKWDNLELSDDSDIEVHPNVDKRSMIKWKREAIHQERAERKAKIEYIGNFIPQQKNVLKKLKELQSLLNEPDGIQRVVQTLDHYQASLKTSQQQKDGHLDIFAAMKAQITTGMTQTSPEQVKQTLTERFSQTEATIQKTLVGAEEELAKLEKESRKKLTSENMFTSETSSKTIINKPKSSKKPKEKTTVIETLNPDASMKDLKLQDNNLADDEDEDEDNDMSPEAAEFSKLKTFEESHKYLSRHRGILNEKTSDSILGEAFTAQLKGQEKYSRQCVTQSVILQNCGQLGGNGVDLFFSKVNIPKSPAHTMFFKHVDELYTRIKNRCAEIAAEQTAEQDQVETIQLQPMGDGSQLTIRVPQPEDVEAYAAFKKMHPNFQKALGTGKLEELNKVLEKLSVPEAEELVKLCSDYGFLDVEGEVVDETQLQK